MKTDRTFGAPEPGKAYRSREGAYLLAVQDGLLAVADTPSGWSAWKSWAAQPAPASTWAARTDIWARQILAPFMPSSFTMQALWAQNPKSL